VSVLRLRQMSVSHAEAEGARVKGWMPFTRTVGSLLGPEHRIDGVNDPIAGGAAFQGLLGPGSSGFECECLVPSP
jgi:hypothetical protein